MSPEEQAKLYFDAVSEFHQNRDMPLSNAMALGTTLPDLLGQLTHPKLRQRLQLIIATNQPLLDAIG